jgi:hypothetical protein
MVGHGATEVEGRLIWGGFLKRLQKKENKQNIN